jgi:hypothetical protein
MDTCNQLRPTRSSRLRRRRWLTVLAAAAACALLVSACGGDDAGASGPPAVSIQEPTDGQAVGDTFEVRFAINFPIGEPDTGRDHVHLYYDGNMAEGEYGIAYSDTFTVDDLPPGRHELEAFVAHADHSVTDAHSDPITVDVGAAGSGTDTTDAPPATSGGGFDY